MHIIILIDPFICGIYVRSCMFTFAFVNKSIGSLLTEHGGILMSRLENVFK